MTETTSNMKSITIWAECKDGNRADSSYAKEFAMLVREGEFPLR
jgi:hypothetical protein